MACGSLYFYSEVLKCSEKVNILFPEPRIIKDVKEDMSVLYLLHGMMGSAYSWLGSSSVERYLYESGKNMIVVMPTMRSNFYTDQKVGWKYFTFVSVELPRLLKSYFRLSPKRENTYVAGLSMGGYGALKCALAYPEQFSFAASFSGATDVAGSYEKSADRKSFYENLFGTPEELKGSENNLYHLLDKNAREQAPLPRLYISCGTSDGLFDSNAAFAAKAKSLGYEVKFHKEKDMGHSWRFWDMEAEKLLRTLL